MSKKINLEEILKPFENNTDHYADQEYDKERIIEAMKEACRQTLELAAEYAEIIPETEMMWATIDKDSIIEVIDLIE